MEECRKTRQEYSKLLDLVRNSGLFRALQTNDNPGKPWEEWVYEEKRKRYPPTFDHNPNEESRLTAAPHFVFICWIVSMCYFSGIDHELRHTSCDIRYLRMNMFMKLVPLLNGKLRRRRRIRRSILFYWKCYFRRRSNDIHLTLASWGILSFSTVTPSPPTVY